jgi:hypothetical protein
MPSLLRSLACVGFVAASLLSQVVNAPGYVSPGPLHRAGFEVGDPAFEALRATGAVVATEDYGSFLLATVDERLLGGREALLKFGLELRDYEAVVGFNAAAFDTAHPPSVKAALDAIPPLFRQGEEEAGLYGRPSLWVVQFRGPMRDAWYEGMEAAGARPVQFIASNAYVVEVAVASLVSFNAFRGDPIVQWSGVYQPWWKLAPGIRGASFADERLVETVLQALEGAPAELVREAFAAAKFVELLPQESAAGYVNFTYALPANVIPTLAADPSIFAIEPRPRFRRQDEIQNQILAGALNVGGTAPTGPGYLTFLTNLGFSSVGQFSFAVDVTDDGVDRGSTTDVNDEFKVLGAAAGASRVVYNHNYSSDALAESGDGHGNINASIIGGYNGLTGGAYEDGSAYNYGLGVCPFVQIGNTKVFDNDGNDDFTANTSTRLSAAYGGGARFSSNSWGTIGFNGYDATTQAHDARVRDAQTGTGGNQELSVIFSAGNDGSAANTVTSPATGKNVICIGATENVRQNGTDGCGYGNSSANNAQDIIDFSSRGPCSDGRIKPDVMAPGVHIIGAASRSLVYDGGGVCDTFEPPAQTLYCQSTGTSHSAPAVAGAAALVRQYFINQSLPTPSPAMVKAVLMTTTRYLGGVGGGGNLVSNTQGTGLVDLGRAFDGAQIQRVDQTQVFGTTGNTHVVAGSVANTAKPFRVGLVWTDKEGATVGNAWVNNLNLTVVIGGNTYKGNVFTGASSVTGGSADTQNNAEFVFLPAGTSGAYTVTVTAGSISGNGVPGNADATDQDFALYIYNGTNCPLPSFTTQPSPESECVGGSASFTAVATAGSAVTYQWRKNAVDIAGATASTYVINPVVAGDAATYDCVATATCGSSTSDPATLTVPAAASFFTQPATQTVCAGAFVSFSAIATGAAPVTYQWRKNLVDIAGATGSSLVLPGVTPASAGAYECVATNICGSATSNTAMLTVNTAPTISQQPAGGPACPGTQFTFTVVASGTPAPGYQWRKNGVNIAGATSSSYVIPSVSAGGAGTYSVAVNNTCGTVISGNAVLTVSSPPSFLSHPAAQTVCEGATVNFTVSASGTALITYQWRKGGVNIPGATSTTLSLVGVTTASAGSYDCVATNSCASVNSNAATLTVNTAASITSPPSSDTSCVGQPASFTVVGGGTPAPTYQWRKNTVNIGGATAATYALASVVAGDAGSYDCVVTNSCGSATSAAATLTVDVPPTIDTSPNSLAICVGDPANFVVAASGPGPLTYQWRRNGSDLSGATGTSHFIAAAIGADAGSYDCVVTNACGSTPSTAATLAVQTAPTIASVSPSLLTPLVPTSPPVQLTLTGTCFLPTTLAVANGVALATTYVSPTTILCDLPPTVDQTQRLGGVRINAQNSTTDVSNTAVVRIGGGSNQGTIGRRPLITNPGDTFVAYMDGGAPFSPVTVILDFGTAAPVFPFPDSTWNLVLAVTPLIGSAGPMLVLYDGLGLYGPPNGAAYDANGVFASPPIAWPAPGLGLVFTSQAVYFDAAAPGGIRLSWASWPELF